MITRYAQWILKHRLAIIILTLVWVSITTYGAQFLLFNNNYRVFFSEDNPQLLAFEALQDTYTANDRLFFMLVPRFNNNVFNSETVKAIEQLTELAWTIPYSSRVDSITNFQHTYALEEDLVVEKLVPSANSLNTAELKRIETIALKEPLLIDRFISPDKQATGVSVVLQLNNAPSKALNEIMLAAEQLIEKIRQQHPDINIYTSGIVALNYAFNSAVETDMSTLVPIMYLLIVVITYLLLRTISGTLTTVIIIGLSIGSTMGIAGWMGIVISPPSVSAPTIIMTLAIADCIHILTTFLNEMHDGKDKHRAIIQSLNTNFKPVFLTSITTAIGFASLNFSDAPPFRDLGNITAMGVIIAFILAVTFLPALVSYLPIRQPKSSHVTTQLNRFSNFVIERHKHISLIMLIIALVLISFIPKIELNDQFVEYFDKTVEFRQHTDLIMKKLTGIYNIEFSLDSGQEYGINDPEYLHHVEAFSNWLRQQPHVLHVNPITDIFKRLNMNMHNDDSMWYTIPDKQTLAAQYLLLYEMSLPLGLDMNDRINVSKSATRLTVTLENLDSNSLREIAKKAEQWLINNTPESMHSSAVSTSIMFAYIGERNIKSMLKGVFVALVLISLILIFALNSFRMGIISLIPNLLPVFMAFGLWAILVGVVGLASSVVAALTMGIVVDDTVHFLNRYLYARRKLNQSKEDAIRYTFNKVGRPLFVTSVILALGFALLILSAFELNSTMGLLTAITISMALVADFLILPALLLQLDKGTWHE